MRRIVLSSLAAIALAAGVTLAADSQPVLTGGAAGIELCPQTICGFALFVGQFQGEVNSKPASGGFVATVRHQNLPPVGLTADVLGGQWTITAGRRTFSGDITGGTILNLNDTQYCVKMVLDLDAGGRGTVHFTGLLDHQPFPPTIVGFVTQEPSPLPCPVL